MELGGDLVEPGPCRGEPPLEVGDPLDDLLLAGGEHGDLAVGRAQLGAGLLELRRAAGPLGRAAGAAALLEVDGVIRALATALEHLERRPDRPRAVAEGLVLDGDDVVDVDGAEP